MVDRREARNGASYSLFVTEPECDAFIAAQLVPGDWTKTFVSVPVTTAITPPNYMYDEGQVSNVVTDVVNDGAFETDLAVYTIPQEMLWDDGDAVSLEAFGEFGTTINGKRIKAYAGSETVFDSGSQIQNDGDWNVVVKIFKSGLNQRVLVSATYSDEVTLFGDVIKYTETTQDMVTDMLIRVTGEGIDPDDVTCKVSTASYKKAV